jgi:thymidylate synthase
MDQYEHLLRNVLKHGTKRSDRTGTGTIGVFGTQTRYDLAAGFPAITTKKLAWAAVVGELLWFLEGSTDERRLAELTHSKPREELIGKTTIWTANADEQGKALGHENTDLIKELGPVYGHQWRDFNGIDQIQSVIDQIKTTPDSRRIIVSAWNPPDLKQMALPPCHTMFQFYVDDGKLSCQLYQRSADLFLGVPFNIASYALLTHIIAAICDLEVGTFVHTIGDAHIYQNHVNQVAEQLSRTAYDLPKLIMPPISCLEDLKALSVSDFVLSGYIHHPPINAPMAV